MEAMVKQWIESLAVPGRPDEFESKQLLRALGIRVPRGLRLEPSAAASHGDLAGPFVVKVCSGEILHKTDQGGVRLGIDATDLEAAVNEMRRRFPDARILVEEQLAFSGTEFILGALVDPDLGPAVMVGAGGILTELYRDVAFRLLPCDTDEARRMLDDLAVGALFRGFRGIDLDADQMSSLISSLGAVTDALGRRFAQLDLNPVVFDADRRFVALDAKIVLRDED